jgi:hypothetical protein
MCEVCLNTYPDCPVCSEEEEPLRTDATSYLDVYCDCPYCHNQVDATDTLKQHLDSDLRASNLEIEVKCDNQKCGKIFIVTNINY